MKKYYILLAPLLAIQLLSCHSNTDTGKEEVFTPNAQAVTSESNGTTKITPADTIGLGAFKEAQKKKYEDSLKLVGINEQRSKEGKRPLIANPNNPSQLVSVPDSSDNIEKINTSNTAKSSSTRESSTASVTKKKKKGMSNGTKGALIGGGAGALTGALVTKHNRGVGALIGAAAGGGAGYLIGHSKDKKEQNK